MARRYYDAGVAERSIARYRTEQRVSFVHPAAARLRPRRSALMAKAQIGYAAMLEQFHPTELVELCDGRRGRRLLGRHGRRPPPAVGAAAGPGRVRLGFMTAAAERTKGDVGPGVTCPSFRQHPAIIAQAAATMAAMYPGRFWLGLGSGEALNEHVVAGYWPEAPERIARMFEAIEIMRKLFTGKDVKHKGDVLQDGDDAAVDDARRAAADLRRHRRADHGQEDRPAVRRADHRRRAGGQDRDDLREVPRGLPRGRQGPGRRSKFILQLHLSWAPTDEEALANAHDRVAQRRHEVPQAGHPLTARLRADGQARAAGGLPGPHADQRPISRRTAARSRSSSTWASTRSTCTTSGATSASGSRRSAAKSCRRSPASG